MKNRNLIQRLGDFMLGKGFYIVLFLCVATIGISGYYLLNSIAGDMGGTSPVTGNPTVVLPDSEANGPDPAGTITPPVSSKPDDQPTGNPEPVTQPDDPEPVKQPAETTPQEDKPTATVFTWPVRRDLTGVQCGDAAAGPHTWGLAYPWRVGSLCPGGHPGASHGRRHCGPGL